jgi:uncharacterized protein (TIGR00725 family)
MVGVMGSGREAHEERATAIGTWLATEGVHLLTGGGGGVMAAVSRAFAQVPGRQGLVIGIIPGRASDAGYAPLPGYPNPWVEVPIFTHLPLSGTRGTEVMSRNHINILSCNVIIALPGASGTASEAALALRYGRPLVAYLGDRDQIDGLPCEAYVEPDLERLKRFVQTHLISVGKLSG